LAFGKTADFSNLNLMARSNIPYKPHLSLTELTLPPGAEWSPRSAGWAVIQIGSGGGFWLQPKENRELETGTVLAVSPQTQGSIRASQIGSLSLQFFHVCPERLTGVLTLNEQRFFETASTREDYPVRILAATSPATALMAGVCGRKNQIGAPARLQLLQIFVELFGAELERGGFEPLPAADATERLSKFLKQTPASELINISQAELVQVTRCTPRHFSRIFREVVGMSLRDKRTELRLARACNLLATTQSKVVDVALESGYQSLSLFNLMFTRHKGLSPGEWRRQNLGKSFQSHQSRRRFVLSN